MRISSRLRAGAALLGLCALLAACGDTDSSPATAPSAGTGNTDPGVVVALDDFAAINALSLGVQPDLVLDVFEYPTSRAIWSEFGVTTQPYGTELDIEKIIAAKPDIIIGVSLPTTTAAKDKLSQIATTTVIDYTADWKTQLSQVGAALGRDAAAKQVTEKITTSITTLKTDLAATAYAGKPVSVLGFNGTPFTVPLTSPLGSVLTEAGLDRPAAQKAQVKSTAPFIEVSAEKLTQHDGAAVFLLTGGAYDPKPFTSSPLWPKLPAVAGGKVFQPSGEIWLGSSPLSITWILDDLRATLIDGGTPAAPAQAGAKLKALSGSA